MAFKNNRRHQIVPPKTRGTQEPARNQPGVRVTDRRSSAAPARDDEEARARVIARAAQMIMSGDVDGDDDRGEGHGDNEQPRRAPGIRTQDTQNRYKKRDYEEMARDFGMHGEDLDRRRQAEESFEQARGVRRRPSDGTGRNQGGMDLDRMRAERSASRPFRFRQFHEMRGRRRIASTVERYRGLDIEQLVEQTRGDLSFGAADQSFLAEQGIGEIAGGWIAYMASAEMDSDRAARRAYDDGEPEWLVRALGESTLTTGGILVPNVVSEDYIELLYAATIFLQGNPMRMQLANGVLTLPRVAGGGTAGWIGENVNVTKSQQNFDAPRLALRYAAALVPWANRLAMHSPQQLAQIVVEDLVRQAAVLIDVACIRGTGNSFQPLGVENQCPAGNRFNQTGTTIASITTDTAKVQRLVEDNKVPTVRPYWMFAPRTRWALMSARDGNNNLVWAREMAMGMFWGKPFGVSTNVPTTLGGGGNESKTYYVEQSQEVYAEGVGADALRVDTRDGVAYFDGSSVVAAFSQDQTVTRVIQSSDLVSRQNGVNIGIIEAQTIA